jgi:hypothetical protein
MCRFFVCGVHNGGLYSGRRAQKAVAQAINVGVERAFLRVVVVFAERRGGPEHWGYKHDADGVALEDSSSGGD